MCPDDDHKFWDSDPTTFDWASVDDEGYVTYTIDPSKDTNEGGDFEIDCLCWVKPGDSCRLLDGDHRHDGLTFTHGTEDKPITIYGESKTNSCIKGSNTQDRALQIAHNHYTVTNLCFDGKHGDEYVSTAVYVLGADKASTDDDGVRSSVTGFKMFKNEVKNWKEECVHLRYFVTYSEIYDNLIHKCGMHCFGDRDEDDYCSVGEAVYVGTALDQVKDGKVREGRRGVMFLHLLIFHPFAVGSHAGLFAMPSFGDSGSWPARSSRTLGVFHESETRKKSERSESRKYLLVVISSRVNGRNSS